MLYQVIGPMPCFPFFLGGWGGGGGGGVKGRGGGSRSHTVFL